MSRFPARVVFAGELAASTPQAPAPVTSKAYLSKH